MSGETPETGRAWGWLAHLRDGGSTPWRQWSGTAEPSAAALPGVQQLELLRRLNDAGRPSADLAGRVLAVDPPRRARPTLPLAGTAAVAEHGPRPVAPAEVRPAELLDLVTVLLSHELAAGPTPTPPPNRRRAFTSRYRLAGDPELVRHTGRHLAARGRPPAERAGRWVVLGADVGTLLADLWTHRALGEGVVPWPSWWRRTAGRDHLPARIDLERIVAAGLAAPGVTAVRLVTDPVLAAQAAGHRGTLPPAQPLAATAVDLGRQVVAGLRPAVPPERRRLLVSEVLRPRLAAVPGPPPGVPAAHRAWAADRSARAASGLSRSDDRYAVRGSHELLLPGDRPGAEAIRARDVLAAGLRVLLDGDGRSAEEGP